MNEPLIHESNPRKENDIESDFNYGNNVMSASADIRKGFLRKVRDRFCKQVNIYFGIISNETNSRKCMYKKLKVYVFRSNYSRNLKWTF